MKLLSVCTRLTGILLLFAALSSCHSARQASAPFVGYIEGVRVVKPTEIKQPSNFIGPDILEETQIVEVKQLVETNVEKGGKMTYMAPTWATKKAESGIEVYAASEVLQQAIALKQYAIENGYDTGYAFLVNISLKSGKKRFYVVNLETMSIDNSGLVAHGRGDERFTFDKYFSNTPGSNCTSLGRYKIGKSYEGQFGLAYKLHGLDSTNNNAFKRFVVLHAMGCISYEETKLPICQSEGCPAVAPQFLEEIKPVIDSRKKPMLLWLFDSAGNTLVKK